MCVADVNSVLFLSRNMQTLEVAKNFFRSSQVISIGKVQSDDLILGSAISSGLEWT